MTRHRRLDAGVEAAGREAWPEFDQTGGSDDGWG
jgi:hypothetical protein